MGKRGNETPEPKDPEEAGHAGPIAPGSPQDRRGAIEPDVVGAVRTTLDRVHQARQLGRAQDPLEIRLGSHDQLRNVIQNGLCLRIPLCRFGVQHADGSRIITPSPP